MELAYARHLAEGVVFKLAPLCEDIMIGGSVRRHKPECTDIDIICIPRRDAEKDMFGTIIGYHVIPEFITAVNQWTKIKGSPEGKYTQRLLSDGTKLEISIATRDTWPTITLIRTGDTEFIHTLMKRALKLGFEQRDGLLWNDSKVVPLKDETDYFCVLNLPFIKPEDRNAQAFRK